MAWHSAHESEDQPESNTSNTAETIAWAIILFVTFIGTGMAIVAVDKFIP